MKLSDIKHLVKILEDRNITDDFDLKFVCNMTSGEEHWPVIEEFILDETDNDNQRFDIGHSDKVVNIFIDNID